jgi:glycosyltransferase involved in cell wall biosynthesis
MNNPLVIASNMHNEMHQVEEWLQNVSQMPLEGCFVVDSGSTDGTVEFFRDNNITVVESKIIQEEGYGPARNHLRECAKELFPNAKWLLYLDGDERIMPEDMHNLIFLCEYLDPKFEVIALPRLDMGVKGPENDLYVHPDYQARLSRLDAPVFYIRRLHEQISNYTGIYAKTTNPRILHLHRLTNEETRTHVGKLCAKLHQIDEYGHTYPEHHKESYYRELFEKEGL